MNSVLSFCFKGDRNYVQGPDIVSKLLDCFSEDKISNIDLKFNGISSTNLNLIEGDSSGNAKVNIRLTLNDEEKVMQLVENGESINCRYEYDENKIIDKTELDINHQQIFLKNKTGFTQCENFVAMNKRLLQTLYQEEKGKWYFTRLEQKRMINNNSLITVKLIKNFNFRLTKSDILLGDEVIGSVYFTMAKGLI